MPDGGGGLRPSAGRAAGWLIAQEFFREIIRNDSLIMGYDVRKAARVCHPRARYVAREEHFEEEFSRR
jgi:hypothetical protein